LRSSTKLFRVKSLASVDVRIAAGVEQPPSHDCAGRIDKLKQKLGAALVADLQELGFGSGMTCWRRLAEWTQGRCPDEALPIRAGRPANIT
jgi:hypothetical protein